MANEMGPTHQKRKAGISSVFGVMGTKCSKGQDDKEMANSLLPSSPPPHPAVAYPPRDELWDEPFAFLISA